VVPFSLAKADRRQTVAMIGNRSFMVSTVRRLLCRLSRVVELFNYTAGGETPNFLLGSDETSEPLTSNNAVHAEVM